MNMYGSGNVRVYGWAWIQLSCSWVELSVATLLQLPNKMPKCLFLEGRLSIHSNPGFKVTYDPINSLF